MPAFEPTLPPSRTCQITTITCCELQANRCALRGVPAALNGRRPTALRHRSRGCSCAAYVATQQPCNTQRATRNTVADPRAAEQAAAAAAVLTVAPQRAWRCAPVGLVEQARAHHPRRGPSARQRSVRRATCNMQHASRNMQHAGRSMEPAASTWRIQLAARNDAACRIYIHISI